MNFDLRIDKQYLVESFHFSSGNYLANLLYQIPILITPILVLLVLGPAESAIYYVAMCIGSFLLEISFTLSTSLFIEGSHGRSMRTNVYKAGLSIYSLLIPCFLGLLLFGDRLLGIYGASYLTAFDLLKLIALSSFFQAIYALFVSIKKVRMGMGSILKINTLWLLIFLPVSYLLLSWMGVVGIGYALIATYIVIDLYIFVQIRKERWI